MFSHSLLELLNGVLVEVVQVKAGRVLLENVAVGLGVLYEVGDRVFGGYQGQFRHQTLFYYY